MTDERAMNVWNAAVAANTATDDAQWDAPAIAAASIISQYAEEVRKEERARIVAWLRKDALKAWGSATVDQGEIAWCADAIERGDV